MKNLKYLLANVVALCVLFNSAVTNGQNRKEVLTVMTYNVHHCNPPAEKGVIDIEGIAGVIKNQGIEIAFLQEIDVKTSRTNGLDQATELSKRTGLKHFHFYKAIDIMGGEYGVMILSKYPLINIMSHKLYQEGDSEQRVIGTADIILPNKAKVMLACTHLDLSSTIRAREINEIDSILSLSVTPFILGGDFNATPESPEMSLFFDKYVSSTYDFDNTFPNKYPNKTIDYIFVEKASSLRVISHKVPTNINFSDHLPVVTEIESLR
jgi:endonuclease/exonuclease/phosphatase family metal-dependent hydrolase